MILDEASVDPLYRKAIRVSVGATLTVPFARIGREDDVLALLAAAGFEAIALSPLGATTLAELRPAPRTAILLGSEGPGLPAALLARTRTVRIPMAEGFELAQRCDGERHRSPSLPVRLTRGSRIEATRRYQCPDRIKKRSAAGDAPC